MNPKIRERHRDVELRQLDFEGDYKLALLNEELFDAFPDWREGNLTWATLARHGPEKIVLRYPVETPEEDVLAIIEAHNPKAKSKNEKAAARRQAKRKTAMAKLKALGLTDAELDALGLSRKETR